MQSLVLVSAVFGCCLAAPQSYGPPQGDEGGVACGEGEVVHVDGTCVTPVVTRHVFLYEAPALPQTLPGPPPPLPPPRVDHNILFVRLPEGGGGAEPIIIPPPRQESIIYVLNKNVGAASQSVIEVTAPPPSNPEVYFINYADGENPVLPFGVDLQTALSAASQPGAQQVPQQAFDDSSNSLDAVSNYDAPSNGVPSFGVSSSGVPSSGIHSNGFNGNDVFSIGVPSNGVPSNGVSSIGVPSNSVPSNDAPSIFVPSNDVISNGVFSNGGSYSEATSNTLDGSGGALVRSSLEVRGGSGVSTFLPNTYSAP